MKTLRENTTLVQASELRTRLDEVLSRLKVSRVILEKHHKPVAVLVDPARYEAMEAALEEFSDTLLALQAKKREAGAGKSDFVALEDALKRLRA